MKLRTIAALVAVPLLMGNQGGCALLSDPAPPAVVDTFCLNAKKRSWSINDTPETARGVQVWNETIDRRCGVKVAGKA